MSNMQIDRFKNYLTNPDKKKRLIWISITILVILLLYFAIVSPIIGYKKRLNQNIADYKRLIEKYNDLLTRYEKIEKEKMEIKRKIDQREKAFFPSSAPSIVAANIQDIMKKIAKDNQITINSTKVLPEKEKSGIIIIPVEMNFRCNINSLKNFLFNIENFRYKLLIEKITIKARRIRRRQENLNIWTRVVVVGFMEKGKK